ncbi:hypothetical protein Cob_v010387 [Colletotrichum orbiculare MAFF 240422]|uniref:Uncharacterized protein n=1 Tax=Colletotrichum orbiculare (strain 104-T / ATCC 96160 / CBS 514.97 / LARS 414 / MAFF 240422) TaxID=1213857 RepID=A0A484FGQ3_COLOR|nr:hypothetical protein Cob_v010387 [Colletotrichum orbiculare MAFF 240422]
MNGMSCLPTSAIPERVCVADGAGYAILRLGMISLLTPGLSFTGSAKLDGLRQRGDSGILTQPPQLQILN